MKARFTYAGIRVKNMERSLRFYSRLLGMKSLGRYRILATGGQVATLRSAKGGLLLELNYYPPSSPFHTKYTVGEGLDHLAFGVPDLDKALKTAKRMGHPVVEDIQGKKSRWAYIKDPNGIWIELFEG
jgi:catechol 2,3-dioxygenase-like lactoylglutathione lyase family enzyme